PQEPAGVLLDREDLALRRVRVHPPASADRKMLDRPLHAPGPAETERKGEALIVRVGAGDVAVVRVPVVLWIGELSAERAADLPEFQILRGQGRLPVRTQHVEVAVLAAEDDAAVADRRRGGDRGSEGRLEREVRPAGERDD